MYSFTNQVYKGFLGKFCIGVSLWFVVGLTSCQGPLLLESNQEDARFSLSIPEIEKQTGTETESRAFSGTLDLIDQVLLELVSVQTGARQSYQAVPRLSGGRCEISTKITKPRGAVNLTITAYSQGTAVFGTTIPDYTLTTSTNTLVLSPLQIDSPWSLSAKEDYGIFKKPDGSYFKHGNVKWEINGDWDWNWLDPSRRVKEFAAGRVTVLALYTDGTMAASVNKKYTYAMAEFLSTNGYSDDGIYAGAHAMNTLRGSRSITKIASAPHHALALLSDGSLYGWGSNYASQLGSTNANTGFSTPQLLTKGGIRDFGGGGTGDSTADSEDYGYTAILKNDGSVWVIGSRYLNGSGPSGQHTTTPVQIKFSNGSPLTDVVQLAYGYDYILALRKDGTIWGWGSNSVSGSRVIDTSDITTDYQYPHQVPLTGKYRSIRASWATSLALRNDGVLVAWGGSTISDSLMQGKILDFAARNFDIYIYTNTGFHIFNGSGWTILF